jgi:hypothetical protein
MKTKTVRVDELEGEALKHIHSNLMRFGHIGPASAETVKKIAHAVIGPTVEVPAELGEVSDE